MKQNSSLIFQVRKDKKQGLTRKHEEAVQKAIRENEEREARVVEKSRERLQQMRTDWQAKEERIKKKTLEMEQ